MRVSDNPDSGASAVPAREVPGPDVAARGRTLIGYVWDVLGCQALLVGLIVLSGTATRPGMSALRPVLAGPALLFCPGYLLSVALFPRSDQLIWVERFGLSIVLSIGIIVFASLGLYFLEMPINRANLIAVQWIVSGLLPLAGIIRRSRLITAEHSAVSLTNRGALVRFLRTSSDPAIVALALLAAAALAYSLMLVASAEHYSEFSVLNPETGRADLPLTIPAATEYELLVSITNQEHGPRRYTVQIEGDNGYVGNMPVDILEDRATWSHRLHIPLAPHTPLHYLKLQLFIADQAAPYRELHLWLKQTGRP